MVSLPNARLTRHEGPSLPPLRPQERESEERGLARRLGSRRFAGYEARLSQVPFDSLSGRIL